MDITILNLIKIAQQIDRHFYKFLSFALKKGNDLMFLMSLSNVTDKTYRYADNLHMDIFSCISFH